jgi:hypothetical protein
VPAATVNVPADAQQHANLRDANGAVALDEHAGDEARDHRPRIQDADEDTDELRRDPTSRPISARARHGGGGDRGEDLDGERDASASAAPDAGSGATPWTPAFAAGPLIARPTFPAIR